ncbi:MAG: hypothetical protein R2862_04285 [Thermoanaerobaculia bacterium]
MAEKKRRLPARAKRCGEEESGPGAMSVMRTVPPGVPSLFHASRP